MSGAPRRVRLNILLYVVALVAAAVTVVVAVAVVDDVRDDPTPSSLPAAGAVEPVALEESDTDEQERLAAVIEAASTEVDALMNVRYDDAQTSIDAVVAGATGEFRDQYEKATDGLVKALKEQQSVQESEVVWTGIVAADPDSATTAVAVSGTVANKATKGEPSARNYRLQVELVLEDGAWLTRDLQFVP